MIRPREHLAALHRTTQSWTTRAHSLRLDLNELVPHLDIQVFEEIVSQLEPWMFTAYPEVNEVYRILAESLGVSTKHIALTSGSDAGIRQVIEAFCDPGDALMITYPTYGMYEVYAHIFNLECITVHYRRDFSIDLSECVERLHQRVKVIAIANPNGAIGCVHRPVELETIIRAASANGTVVLLDEAYIHYFEDHWAARIDSFDNFLLVRTFSKAGGLAGLRFGYILSNPTLCEWVMKTKPVVEINSIAALVGRYLIQHPQVIQQAVVASQAGKAYLIEKLSAAGFEVYNGHANFVQVKFGPYTDVLYKALNAHDIRVKDQTGSDILEEYTRITVGPQAEMERLLAVIESVIAS